MYKCVYVSTHKKRSGRVKATWECYLRGVESGTEHLWQMWETSGVNLMIAAGHLPEHASEDKPIYVYLDIEKRCIRECMNKGWKPITQKQAHEKFAHDAGRLTKAEAKQAMQNVPGWVDIKTVFPRKDESIWNK